MLDQTVVLPSGLEISERLLRFLHQRLTELHANTGLRFWEIVHLARNPTYQISPRSKQDLFETGLLGHSQFMYYRNQVAILFLVEGNDQKPHVISQESLEKLITKGTS